MPLLSTLYFVGTAMFDYFEVNLWLALYGVCIEAKQVIIKNKIKCCKNTNHGVGLLDPRLTFSPLVTGHFSCSEWDHSHMSVTVFHLYLFWEGKVVVWFFFNDVLLNICIDDTFSTHRWPWSCSFIAWMLNCINLFNDVFPHQVCRWHEGKCFFLKSNLY